jgi:signal transduction histidine kinase
MQEQTSLPLLHRLSFRLALWVVAVALALGFLFSALQIYLDYFSVQREFDKTTQQVLNTLKKPAAQAAYHMDSALADEVMLGLFNYAPIYKVALLDDRNQLLAGEERPLTQSRWRWASDWFFGRDRHYSVPLYIDQEDSTLYGMLEVALDTHLLATGFLERSVVELTAVLTRNLLLVAFVFFLLHYLVNKPLSKMAARLSKIDPLNPEKNQLPLPAGHQKDELGVLVCTTNHLLRAINEKVTERDQLLHEMETAKQSAEAANVAKSQFIAKMSHELRTPLNAVIGYSEMLQEEVHEMEPDEIANDLGQIIRAGVQLLDMVNDVLDISRIETGQVEFHRIQFSVADMAGEILQTVEPWVKQNSNKLESSMAEELGCMYADIGKVRQSVLNILNNACKYTENGDISLSISRTREGDTDWVHFQVRDTGIGIAPERRQAIFEMFDQADNSYTRQYDGMGLGLAISGSYAKMMGGQVTVESEVGKGSVFTLHLPAEVRLEKCTVDQ